MAARASNGLGILSRGLGRHSGKIGLGLAAAGILGGMARSDRNIFQSTGGAMWGGFKGGFAGGIVGGGIGGGIGVLRKLSKPGILGFAVAGATAGIGLAGGFGAFKGGLGSNRPVNRIRGLHQ